MSNCSVSCRTSSSLLVRSCCNNFSIRFFSLVNLAIKSTFECSFLRALVLTSLHREANSKVLTVSSRLEAAGLTHAKSSVRELPINASFNSSVNFESRNAGAFPPPGFVSSEMTRPSVVSDWLMPMPSLRRLPSAPVFFCRSLPARSTKCNLACLSVVPPTSVTAMRICIVKIACDREEVAFICVAPTARRFAPKSSNSSASPKL
mmetsp:Transcript_52270/g.150528  ORF Transcript_52270/g.150528 Transcript_52270/m.150528 type:complete len:205 (-) Transcript_52270:567-1181(-)